MDSAVEVDTDSGVDVEAHGPRFGGGYTDPVYAIAIAGEACPQQGATACTGHNGAGTLSCAGDPRVWTQGAPCDADHHCDTQFGQYTGTCRPIDYHCFGRNPGDLACEFELSATARGHCNLDLVGVDDAPGESCRGQTTCDPNANAICSCQPGFATAAGDTCIDVGACATDNGGCLPEATCKYTSNTTHACQCPAARVGDGVTACTQVWTREFGGPAQDYATHVALDGSGNVYVSGATQGGFDGLQVGGSSDGFVVKFDAAGTKQWSRLIGSSKSETFISSITDANGNTYVGGDTDGDVAGTNAGSYDLYIIKLDSAGVEQWSHQIGTSFMETGGGLAVDATGNVYLAGEARSIDGQPRPGGSDILLIKYSSDGQELWSREYGGDGQEFAGGMTTDADGNLYMGGSVSEADASNRSDLVLSKYDSAGNLLWSRQRDFSEADFAGGILIDPDGALLVDAAKDDSFGRSVYFVLKYDSAGQELTAPALPMNELISAIDSSGNLFTFRSLDPGLDARADTYDALLTKYDGTGQKLWDHQYGQTGEDFAGDMVLDPSGNIYLAGGTTGIDGYTSAGSDDVFILKVDSAGNEL